MAKTIAESAVEAVGELGGSKAKAVAGFAVAVYSVAAAKKKRYEERLRWLENPKVDPNWAYNGVILRKKNYVSRHFGYYNPPKDVSIKKIQREIAHGRPARNVIVTGAAGSGKTTVLKWLFLNLRLRKDDFQHVVYISSRMVLHCESLRALADYIEDGLRDKGRCLVFFDGMDELPFVTGEPGELGQFLALFEDSNSATLEKAGKTGHKFVISTRPEHFGFTDTIKNRGSERSLDTFVVFEVLPLSQKEALMACKLVKNYKNTTLKSIWPTL